MKHDPDPVIRLLEGYRATALVRAALELDLFTRLPGTAASVARAARCSERGVRIALDALSAMGLVRKSGARYAHTPLSRAFLSRRSPASIAEVSRLFVHERMWRAYFDLPGAIRAGRSVLARDAHAPNQEFWLDFARITARQSLVWAEALARMVRPGRGTRVLDVACGSGVYGLAMAARGADVTLFDQAYVLRETRRVARGRRARFLAGDIFRRAWGGPYDVVILSHVLHHFDARGCADLLRRARAALAPGGTLAIQEFVPDDARKSRLRQLMFGVTMLLWTKAGDAYTWRELRGMIGRAGFRRARISGWSEPRQVILAEKARSRIPDP